MTNMVMMSGTRSGTECISQDRFDQEVTGQLVGAERSFYWYSILMMREPNRLQREFAPS